MVNLAKPLHDFTEAEAACLFAAHDRGQIKLEPEQYDDAILVAQGLVSLVRDAARRTKPVPQQATCVVCGKHFEAQRSTAKYCSRRCTNRAQRVSS